MRVIAPSIILVWLSVVCLFCPASCFEWSTAGSRPQVDRRAIAGIWKLTPLTARKVPMKEFTVYPKKNKKKDEKESLPELLLMLKEDGSFRQYTSETNEKEHDGDLTSSWNSFQKARKQKKKQHLDQFIQGTWDYLDGDLILAADRPSEAKPYSTIADGGTTLQQDTDTNSPPKQQGTTAAKDKDTLLKGRVVASYQTRLQDNPVLGEESNNNNNTTSSSSSTALDTHLSVPKGSINVGKFFYPKNHPSFFEQPMFQPVKKGAFALRQVLGSLNTEQDEAEQVEKFQRSDFYNKTFLLSTQPIVPRMPKGNMRWSIKYNKFVHDPPSKKAAKAAEEANQRAIKGIRVMQIAFHANNTFSTVAGLGEAAILRGKFDVIGTDKDHLWMQVVRFGFGRSVSGSVFSEGPMLSHEDAKAYWGKICIQGEGDSNNNSDSDQREGGVNGAVGDAVSSRHESNEIDNNKDEPLRLEVTGSVLDGWGLEPLPVARFIMRETESDADLLLEEEEDYEEEDDEEDEIVSENIANLDTGLLDDQGIDWESTDDSFQ